jgi:hypothetical protein
MQRHLKRGATLVLTPALIRALGPSVSKVAGVQAGPSSAPAAATGFRITGRRLTLENAVELDASVQADGCESLVLATMGGQTVPFLTTKTVGRGRVLVLNVRTFTEQDFRAIGEWLLTPRDLGFPNISPELADAIRKNLLAPLRVDFHGPAGVALVLFDNAACVYSFRDDGVQIQLGGKQIELPAHRWLWVKSP